MATAHPEIDLHRAGKEAPPVLDTVKAAKELSDARLRENVTNWLLTIFCASTIATYVLIYFWDSESSHFRLVLFIGWGLRPLAKLPAHC